MVRVDPGVVTVNTTKYPKPVVRPREIYRVQPHSGQMTLSEGVGSGAVRFSSLMKTQRVKYNLNKYFHTYRFTKSKLSIRCVPLFIIMCTY